MLKLVSRPIAGFLLASLIPLKCFAGTFVPIPPVSGAMTTAAHGINDNNVIVGNYTGSDFVTHGFFGTLDGQYTTFDYGDGSRPTLLLSIDNAHDIAGVAYQGLCQSTPFERMADGTVIVLHKKKTDLSGLPGGFNKSGEFVGYYCDSNGHILGYYAKNGTFKNALTIAGDPPYVAPMSINKAGEVAGYFTNDGSLVHGFLLINGSTTQIDYPGLANTELSGINDHGTVIGIAFNQSNNPKSFLYDIKTQKFKLIDDNGIPLTAVAINNQGNVLINFSQGGNALYCPKAKNCPATALRTGGNASSAAPR